MPFCGIVEMETQERFDKFLLDMKNCKTNEWLSTIGLLTRLAKKKFDLFQNLTQRL